MTKEEAKELLPIIQAFVAGKTLQVWTNNTWKDENYPFFGSLGQFRIKPEPKYRPFKNREECWQEMLRHQPLGWIKNECGNIFNIIAIFKDSIKLNECRTYYDDLCEQFKFIDGTPLGIKE